MNALLDLEVAAGPVLVGLCVVAIALVILLLARETSVRWAATALIAVVAGASLGLLALWFVVDVADAFGGPVNLATGIMVPAASAGIALAIVSLPRATRWRRVMAIIAIPVFALTAGLVIVGAYGIQRTIGDILYIDTTRLAPSTQPATALPDPLWQNWEAPADMPATGEWGVVDPPIGNEASGFDARPAQVYYPPAALVESPPELPLLVFMMGQPGEPSARVLASTLDDFAARHDGLAPIVLVVDQLGAPTADPLCLDTVRGNAETYLSTDVVDWARSNLGVSSDRTRWIVGGYSNGGQCAAYLGAVYPETFGNIIGIAPEEFAGESFRSEVLESVFGGDQAAYDAVKTPNILAAGDYPDSWAVFAVGADDPGYIPDTKILAAAARDAGMRTEVRVLPGTDHGVSVIERGLAFGLETLAPRLGLAR
ncbi:esterase [Agromyces atrinae]|uniref:alpha/beta hydrolase n=1 Tax=Agromyces atrinae TaxID=592376 RepID=UPI001F565602|nr:esterase [Agromyces atrinae]MCI2956942.1 esterase [Agromyces atrinae]